MIRYNQSLKLGEKLMSSTELNSIAQAMVAPNK
ncbi:uncharacterized protein METZ01_LOCUS75357, partial [marine metagenome]